MLSDSDRRKVAAAARRALTQLDVVSLELGEVIDGGSRSRSLAVRARAEPRSGDPVDVVIKLTVGSRDGFVRERAALSLVADHRLPGAVRMLGHCDDPPLVVLADLGHGPTVADFLLGDKPEHAERALVDWAATVGTLQAASTRLGDEFRARLTDPSSVPSGASGHSPSPTPSDRLADRLTETVDTLEGLLRPLQIRPGPAAFDELHALIQALDPRATGPSGLVPGDTCPDNALYVDGRLTLIDFEAAAHRHVAWEAAYLLVPWPSCWCSWALPDTVVQNALTGWREVLATTIPDIAADSFEDDLARATIAWTFGSLTFLLARALAEPDRSPAPSPARPRPDLRALVAHRLRVAAGYSTAKLPALRDLAGQIHDECSRRWGKHALELAPAFRPAH